MTASFLFLILLLSPVVSAVRQTLQLSTAFVITGSLTRELIITTVSLPNADESNAVALGQSYLNIAMLLKDRIGLGNATTIANLFIDQASNFHSIVTNIQAGRQYGIDKEQWILNGSKIVNYLTGCLPSIQGSIMMELLTSHLNLIISEANGMIKGNYQSSYTNYFNDLTVLEQIGSLISSAM